MQRKKRSRTNDSTKQLLLSSNELQDIREVAPHLPKLLQFCSSLIKRETSQKLENYARVIADEATTAKTIEPLARSLAISDENNSRSFLSSILAHCSAENETLLRILLWLSADADEAVSNRAFATLGHLYGVSTFVTSLTNNILKSELVALRAAGATILSNAELGPRVLQTIFGLLGDKNWTVRQILAEALGRSHNKRVIAPLIELLKDDDDDVRQTAIESLAKLGARQANRRLFSILRNSEDALRTSAAKAVAVLGNKRQALAEILGLLKDEDWEIRQGAAEALGQLRVASALDALVESLRDSDPDVRQSAAMALGHLGRSEAVEPLLRSLKDENVNVRNGAASALVMLSNENDASEAIERALSDKSRLVRQRASQALGEAGDSRAMKQLLRALRYKDADARMNAAKALGAIHDERAIKPLVKALRDTDSNVKQSAVHALAEIGGAGSVRPLIKALNDSDDGVFFAAVDALSRLGQGSRVIQKLLKDLRAGSRLNKSHRIAQALARVGQGDVQLLGELLEIANTGSEDIRLFVFLSLKALAASNPSSVLETAQKNLIDQEQNSHARILSLEIIGRCAFLGEENAIRAIEELATSSQVDNRIASGMLFGELLPILPSRAIKVFNKLVEDNDWTMRETLGRPLTRRAVFLYDSVAPNVDRLIADDEIAVVMATNAAATRWIGSSPATESPRIRRYMNRVGRSRMFNQWAYQEASRTQGGFDPFIQRRSQDLSRLSRDLRRYGTSLFRARDRSDEAEREMSRRQPSFDFKSIDLTLRQIAQSRTTEEERIALENLLRVLPDPLIFYLVFKAAPTDSSRAVRRLFYEIASLVEKVDWAEIVTTRRADSRLRQLLPTLLESLEKGFRKLEPSEFADAYAAEFSSLRRLLTVSSLPEIPIALAASERELAAVGSKRVRHRSREIWLTFNDVNAAIEPLRQYSDDAPLSLRTVPLSEAISKLEITARFIGFESTEPYRTIFLQILSSWRELLRSAIRRLEGEARLVFSTLEEVAAGERVNLVLEIRNLGSGPASNIQITLHGKGLAEVIPQTHKVAALAQNESETVLFTAISRLSNLIVEFVATYDDLLAKRNISTYSSSIAIRTLDHAWNKIINPYLPGKPDPDLQQFEKLFVGREDVLSFILDNLIGSAAERIIVLYGHRRTGKTWTLLRLRERLPDAYIPIYIDMQAYSGVSGAPALLQNFAHNILTGVKETCNISSQKLRSIHVPTFEDYEKNYPYYFESCFLASVEGALGGKKLLWLIDEFQALEDMVSRRQLEPTFMEFLRHLMQFGKMAFVFAGTREVTGKYWSVFFNIAVNRKIGVLSDSDAAKLVIDPVKIVGVRHDRFAVPLVKQFTGNHPYYIQLLCDKVVSQLNLHKQMLVNAQIIEDAVNELVIPGTSNVKFYWDEVMDDRERAAAGAMQELLRRRQATDVKTIWTEFTSINPRITAQDVTATLKSLTDKDLLEKSRGALDTYKFRIGLVERYIGAHVPYADTQERIGKSW
jgi:HEAT repeat protein